MDSPYFPGMDLMSQFAPQAGMPQGQPPVNPAAIQAILQHLGGQQPGAGSMIPQGAQGGGMPPQIQQLVQQLIQQRLAGGQGMPGQMPAVPQGPGMGAPGAGGGAQNPIAQMLLQRILQGGGQGPMGGVPGQAPGQGPGSILQALMGARGGAPGMGQPQPQNPNAASLLQMISQMQAQGGAPGQAGTAPGLVRGPQAPVTPRSAMQPRPQMPTVGGGPLGGILSQAQSPPVFSPFNPAPTVGVGEFSSPDTYRRNQ